MANNTPYSEKELLLQVVAGNEKAFRTIFNYYKGKLYTYVLKITDSREAAEDTVHDVFLKIWADRTKFAEIENLNSYLYRMAHNHAVSGFRRMAKETLILAELRHESIPAIQLADPLTQKEIRTFIAEAVAKLSPQQKKVFILSRYDGLKHKEIAGELGLSVNTVRSHIQEGLRIVREEISRSYGPLTVAIFVIHELS
ncbi:MAG: RNA polymerase sigma-70 factor [Bacteroidota bacterium]